MLIFKNLKEANSVITTLELADFIVKVVNQPAATEVVNHADTCSKESVQNVATLICAGGQFTEGGNGSQPTEAGNDGQFTEGGDATPKIKKNSAAASADPIQSRSKFIRRLCQSRTTQRINKKVPITRDCQL